MHNSLPSQPDSDFPASPESDASQQAEALVSETSSQPEPETSTGLFVERMLRHASESLNLIGKGLMGSELWEQVRDEVQETIALVLLISLPSLIGRLVTGRDYESFNQCSAGELTDPLNVNRYICYIMITSDFLLWIGVGARILTRFLMQALKPLLQVPSSLLDRQNRDNRQKNSSRRKNGNQNGR